MFESCNHERRVGSLVVCSSWKGLHNLASFTLFCICFKVSGFRLQSKRSAIYNLTLKSLAGVGQPWVCYGLKRITQGGGEGDGGLSCAWARPEPGCPHTDRGRVQRTLATTLTLGPRTRALQILVWYYFRLFRTRTRMSHSALALHCIATTIVMSTRLHKHVASG